MKCKFCGGDRFYGHQIVRVNIIVDENQDYVDGVHGDMSLDVYDSEPAYGPFQCIKCGAEYDVLADGEKELSDPVIGWEPPDEEYVCPVCGAEIDIGSHFEDAYGGMTASWKCKECGTSGVANYEHSGYYFVSHDVDLEDLTYDK